MAWDGRRGSFISACVPPLPAPGCAAGTFACSELFFSTITAPCRRSANLVQEHYASAFGLGFGSTCEELIVGLMSQDTSEDISDGGTFRMRRGAFPLCCRELGPSAASRTGTRAETPGVASFGPLGYDDHHEQRALAIGRRSEMPGTSRPGRCPALDRHKRTRERRKRAASGDGGESAPRSSPPGHRCSGKPTSMRKARSGALAGADHRSKKLAGDPCMTASCVSCAANPAKSAPDFPADL
jgi:hypothetical protein